MALTKISTGMLKQDAASSDLNIDAGTLYLDVSNNRVGIATTSPGSKLTVEGDIRQTTGDLLYAGGGNWNIRHLANGQNITFDTTTGSTTSEKMRIRGDGNVGIGTTTPSEKLQVDGNIALNGELKLVTAIRHANSGAQVIDNDNNTYFIINDPEGSNRIKIGDSGDASNTYRNTTHKFEPASGTEYMRIDSAGRVGIGETGMSSYDGDADDLVVKTAGNTGITVRTSSTGTGNIFFADGISGAERYQGTIRYFHNGNVMTFGTSASERMRIDASGNLLVGKTSTVFATAGTQLYPNGEVNITKSGTPLHLNRLSSDGTISTFYKDGTTVGSIASDSGAHLVVKGAGNNAALLFNHASSRIEPYSNGVTDLGRTNARFKDVWVSNGIQGSSTMYWSLPHTSGGALRLEFGNYNNTARRTVQFYKDNVEPLAAYTDLISLGQSTNRFKDLYLSGGVNVLGNSASLLTQLSLANASTDLASGSSIDFQTGSGPTTTSRITSAYSSANKTELIFSTYNSGLTESMRISDGKVGIGTSAPDSKLSVTSSTINSEDILYLKSGADSVNDYLGIAWELGAGGNGPHSAIRSFAGPSGSDARLGFLTTSNGGTTLTEGLSIAHNGNVGIGTTSPTTDVTKFGGSASGLSVAGGQPVVAVRATSNAQYVGYFGQVATNTYLGAIGGGDLLIQTGTGGTEKVRITSGGNVGIGTTSPGATLHTLARSGTTGLLVQGAASNNVVHFARSDGVQSLIINSDGKTILRRSGSAGTVLVFEYGAAQAGGVQVQSTGLGIGGGTQENQIFLKTDGKVGIGTASPDLKLDVSHGTTTEYVATFQNTADNLELKIGTTTGALLNIQGQIISSSAAYNIGLQTDGGNVGIGTSNPATKLHVAGATTITSTDSMLLTLNPTANNYGGILYKYGGVTKGTSIYNTGMMVYGGESGTNTALQAGGQYGLFIHNSTRAVGIGTGTASPVAKLEIRGSGGGTELSLKTTDASANETFFVQDGGRVGVRYYPFTVGIPSTTTHATNAIFQVEEAGNIFVNSAGAVGFNTTNPLRPFDSRHALNIFGSGGYTELMLRGRAGTAQNLGAWHWSIRADVGGNNDDLKLLRFTGGNSPTYAGIAMQIQNSTGNVNMGVGELQVGATVITSANASNAFIVKTNHSGNPTALQIGGNGAINGVASSNQSFTILNVAKDSGSGNSAYFHGNIKTGGNINPAASGTQNLGSSGARWANVYTGDLHLSNEEKGGNDVDGTTGNWTVQEGEENLYLINNKTGKKYKFALEEIE